MRYKWQLPVNILKVFGLLDMYVDITLHEREYYLVIFNKILKQCNTNILH